MPGKRASEEERRRQILDAAFAVAARERLHGLTVRAVASEAGLSPGLVFFHFKTKAALLLALLDWLLGTTLLADTRAGEPFPGVAATPREAFLDAVRREVAAIPAKRTQVELFFDYWVRGTRHPEIRRRIRIALHRYRGVFRDRAEAMVAAEPDSFPRRDAEGLSAAAVSFIEGCAVQAVIDPSRFDVARYLGAVEDLLGRGRAEEAPR